MNLSGKSVTDSCTGMFSDVASDWGCKYIESALAHGYIAKNATFRPNDTITKAESMKLIAQARGIARVQTTSDWQADWMMTGYKNSLVDAKYMDHNTKATRGWIFSLGANPIQMMSDDMMMKDDMMKDEMMDDSMMMKKEGAYIDYSEDMLGKYEHTVLFFHASWCPSCRATDTNLEADDVAGSGIGILKVNYDDSTELKKKYGVTYQHTFVSVDTEGNMIKKWSGSNDLEDIMEQLK